MIRKGSTGSAVLAWQQLLADSGHALALDGYFGPQTKNETTMWQMGHRLAADGIVGPQTYAMAGEQSFPDRAILDVLIALSEVRNPPGQYLVQSACIEFRVNTRMRLAHFLGQCAHETGGWRWFEEIWGPTTAQKRYEPPSSLAKTLGNTNPGDGKLFKGRGAIMLTGRYNYTQAANVLAIPLVDFPERAAFGDRWRVAGLFWSTRKCNVPADRNDVAGVTRIVNGGTNGLADRKALTARAIRVLGIG